MQILKALGNFDKTVQFQTIYFKYRYFLKNETVLMHSRA